MKVVLVSRYPRVDRPAWKRRVAADLAEAGCEVAVLFSRSDLKDQIAAGLKEFGALGALKLYLAKGSAGGGASVRDGEPSETLTEWSKRHDARVLECRRLGDSECMHALRAFAPDLLVLVGADIVPRSVLEVPRLGTINAHYGLLPAYRGMNVTEWSVYRGDTVGVSVHMVDPGIDTGDILATQEISIETGETFTSLREKHQATAARLLVRCALALRAGTAERQRQDPADGRQYYRMHPSLRAVAETRLKERARNR
jgi:folate-dependent phosphoribosylglycinamide formyltransferase PurN